jgi:hypothetical protein
MAYILRSLAVIGVIALNSPVLGDRAEDGGAVATISAAAQAATQVDPQVAIEGIRVLSGTGTAAREAAQILAGLDPETRQRALALMAEAAAGRSGAAQRGAAAPTR